MPNYDVDTPTPELRSLVERLTEKHASQNSLLAGLGWLFGKHPYSEIINAAAKSLLASDNINPVAAYQIAWEARRHLGSQIFGIAEGPCEQLLRHAAEAGVEPAIEHIAGFMGVVDGPNREFIARCLMKLPVTHPLRQSNDEAINFTANRLAYRNNSHYSAMKEGFITVDRWNQDRLLFEQCDSVPEIVFLMTLLDVHRDAEPAGPLLLVEPQFAVDHYITVDFMVEGKVAVEIDGAAYHSSPEAKDRDARRDEKISRRGLKVIRIPAGDLLKDPRPFADHVLSEAMPHRKDRLNKERLEKDAAARAAARPQWLNTILKTVDDFIG